MSGQRCETCRYSTPARFIASGDGDQGLPLNCRRRAPAVLFTINTRETVWPRVHLDDWCGEYQPRRGAARRKASP